MKSKRMTKAEHRAYQRGMRDQFERDLWRMRKLTVEVYRSGGVRAQAGLAEFAQHFVEGLVKALNVLGPGRSTGEPEVIPGDTKP